MGRALRRLGGVQASPGPTPPACVRAWLRAPGDTRRRAHGRVRRQPASRTLERAMQGSLTPGWYLSRRSCRQNLWQRDAGPRQMSGCPGGLDPAVTAPNARGSAAFPEGFGSPTRAAAFLEIKPTPSAGRRVLQPSPVRERGTVITRTVEMSNRAPFRGSS